MINTFFEPTLVQVFAPNKIRESPKFSGTYATLTHPRVAAAKASGWRTPGVRSHTGV
jgi:hypothetical protein